MSAHNLDTVEYFLLAAQKLLMGNNAGVFPDFFFFLVTLTCPVSISDPHNFASQVLQWLEIFFLGIAFADSTQDQSM